MLLDNYSPVWARGLCRISPPRFLAECCKRQLNQVSFVLLYFRLSTFSDLYWVCLSVFSCTVLFVSISQVIGCEDCLRNDLYCVKWGVKLYSNSNSWTVIVSSVVFARQAIFSTLYIGKRSHLMALCPGLLRWAATRKVKQSGFYWSKRQWVAVA